MKSAICPKCFAEATEDNWVYSCRRDSCKAKGVSAPSSQVSRGRGDVPVCPECKEPYASPLCPSCGFPTREEEAGAESFSISLVGAEGCGKSHFISVLIDEMKHHVAKTYNCSLFPLGGDDTISLYERQYYQPLFEHGHILGPTEQDDVNPLIYSLVFQNEKPVKALDLIFYDSCGATFESITLMANANRSLYHSGGVIFMIEPTQLRVMREWAASHGGNICEADAVSMLSRTVQLIRTGSGQKNMRQKIDVPIAVCISKLDVMRPLLDAGSFLASPSRHFKEAKFDKLDFNACNLETQSIIEAWGGGEIVRQVASQFSDYAFFGISSLGEAPAATGSVQRVAPHRITDPLLWLLSRKNIIK